MQLPGSYQIGLGAKLLRRYPWWEFKPHPEWVTPRGTTLLGPNSEIAGFDLGQKDEVNEVTTADFREAPELADPKGEWQARHGNFRAPYAAGVAGEVRVVYIPYFGWIAPPPPTILALEPGVHYHAYYWEPMLGIKIDLGRVERPAPGAVIVQDSAGRVPGKALGSGEVLHLVDGVDAANVVVSVDAHSNAKAGLLVRYRNADNFVAAIYSAKDRSIYLSIRTDGKDSDKLGETSIASIGPQIRMSAEVRSGWATAQITDGTRTYATPIVDVHDAGNNPAETGRGQMGIALLQNADDSTQSFEKLDVRHCPTLVKDERLQKTLSDAQGIYRGELSGPAWNHYGKNKAILLGSYRPERPPTAQDWLLVLDADNEGELH
jgi:hypothetical protein